MSPVTPQDIVNKEFREAFRGYNENDVDNFLDEVAEEFARLSQESQRMKIQLASLQQEAALGGGGERAAAMPADPKLKAEATLGKTEAREEMKRALVATQRASEAALEEAKRRATEIIARAEERAREIDNLIASRAKEVDADAAGALEHAQVRVEELRKQEAELRTRLRRLLADHVRALQTLEVEGAEIDVRASGDATADRARAAVVERMAQDLGDATDPAASAAQTGGEFWKR
jgi:cell division initiation protein